MSTTAPDSRVSEYDPVVATTDFAANFPVFDNDDLIVIHDGVERDDFAVSATYAEGISTNAKVVFAIGITGNVKVVGRRDPHRTSRFINGGALPIRDFNLALDTLQAEMQEARRDIGQSFRAPYGLAPPEIPGPLDRRVLGWNGQVLSNIDPAEFVNDAGFATAAQGAKADSALQPETLSVDDDHLAAPSRIRNKLDFWTIFDFFSSYNEAQAVRAGSATGDHLAYLQAAADSQEVVQFPPRVFNVSNELVIKDGTKLIGSGANWKRRTGYSRPTDGNFTCFKWIGADASLTAVVRVSSEPVGTAGDDFSAPGTDDLVNVILRDIHVDADNKARYGWYIYRVGNQSTIGNLTAEKARLRNFVFLGCFASRFGHFGAYECQSHGVSVGEDLFAFGVEAACFEFSASFHLCNNGTNGTFVLNNANPGSGSDYAESGGIFCLGRGSSVIITSEGNFGRAAILKPSSQASGTDGPADYHVPYIEANGGGIAIDYRPGTRGHRIYNGFIHPGNGSSLISQDICIRSFNAAGVETDNEGPTDSGQWLVLERLFGELSGVGFAVHSNTSKYRARDCARTIVFSEKYPASEGVFARAFFKADATLSDTRLVAGGTLTRQSAGRFRLTFTAPQADANYSVSIQRMGSGTVTHFLQIGPNKGTDFVEIEQFASGALGTPVDTATGFVEIACMRLEDGR